jgi:hypothetical protein
LILHYVGLFVFARDGTVVANHGPKMLDSGDVGKLCAAPS